MACRQFVTQNETLLDTEGERKLLRMQRTSNLLIEAPSSSVECIISLKMSEGLVFQCCYRALDSGNLVAMAVFKISHQASRVKGQLS